MPTRLVGTWEGGLITAELDYDTNDRANALRVINNAPQAIYLEAVQGDRGGGVVGRKYSAVFLPGTTTEIPIPTGPAVRLNQLWDPARQRWDGIAINAVYPAAP